MDSYIGSYIVMSVTETLFLKEWVGWPPPEKALQIIGLFDQAGGKSLEQFF